VSDTGGTGSGRALRAGTGRCLFFGLELCPPRRNLRPALSRLPAARGSRRAGRGRWRKRVPRLPAGPGRSPGGSRAITGPHRWTTAPPDFAAHHPAPSPARFRTGAAKLSAGRGEPQRSARCPARLIAGQTTSPAGPHRAGDGAGRAVRGAGRRLGNGSECHAEHRRVRSVSRPEYWRPGDKASFLQRTSTPEQRPNKFGPTAPVGPIHSATRPASNAPGKAPADVSLFERLGQAFGVVMSPPSPVKVRRHSPHRQASGGCCFLPGGALPESPPPSALREQGLGAPPAPTKNAQGEPGSAYFRSATHPRWCRRLDARCVRRVAQGFLARLFGQSGFDLAHHRIEVRSILRLGELTG